MILMFRDGIYWESFFFCIGELAKECFAALSNMNATAAIVQPRTRKSLRKLRAALEQLVGSLFADARLYSLLIHSPSTRGVPGRLLRTPGALFSSQLQLSHAFASGFSNTNSAFVLKGLAHSYHLFSCNTNYCITLKGPFFLCPTCLEVLTHSDEDQLGLYKQIN